MARLLLIMYLFFGLVWGAAAEQLSTAEQSAILEQKNRIRLQDHSPAELENIFKRIEALLEASLDQDMIEPIQLILHGDESHIFMRQNYGKYKPLVNLAARLDAFGLVEIRACEAWMGANGYKQEDLTPFVDLIPSGPKEIRRLDAAGYVIF